MKIKVVRELSTEKSTPGVMWVDGDRQCYTLEDVVRPQKIMHETAIPAGTYKVVVTMSNRFKRELPLLLDVPGYEGVRIHPGNTDKDTSGCILVGVTRGEDMVGGSRTAFNTLFDAIQAARAAQELITLEVS